MNKEKQIRRMVEKFGKFKIVDFSQSLLYFSTIDAYVLFRKTRTTRESKGEFKASYEFNNGEAAFIKTLDKDLYIYFANDNEKLELVVPLRRVHGLFKNLQNDVLVRHRASITFRRSDAEFFLNYAGKINVAEYSGLNQFMESGIEHEEEILISRDKLLLLLIQIGVKKGLHFWVNSAKNIKVNIESYSEQIIKQVPRLGSEIDDKIDLFDLICFDNDKIISYWSINEIDNLSEYFDLFLKIKEINLNPNFSCILPFSAQNDFFAKVNEQKYFDKHLFENIAFYDHNSINKLFEKFVTLNSAPLY